MQKKPTIHDIAEYAGVGAGTVSRVINKHPNVSAKTRNKVLAAMKVLGYRPSFYAQNLRNRNSKIIGFLTDAVATTPHATDIIRGAQDAAWENEKILMLMNTAADGANATSAIELLLEREVEGIIYATMWHHEVNIPSNALEVPIILVNCFTEDERFHSTIPDDFDGGYQAMNYLIQHGHRRIGFINLPTDIPAGIERLAGYRQALDNANIPFDSALAVGGKENESEAGYRHTLELLNLDNPPTAIFAGTDKIAVGVYDAIKEVGLQIPRDISVIGFDNQELITTSLRPPLTTIQLPHYEMGYRAMEFLSLQEYTRQNSIIIKKLPCPVVPRASVQAI